ncbi:MAG: hypothetical protein KYX68_08075 [Flavobacterium sp.]|nr:hypothetical protein [Flavobacterium sp.]
MNKGFIKLSRDILDWEWYQDANSFRLMVHLLLKANYTVKKWQGITINPGELITSLDNLSKETGLTVNSIRYALKKLKSSGYICMKSTNKFTLIKISESDIYNDFKILSHKQNFSYSTNEPQTNNNPITTTNKVNKEIDIKERKDVFKNQIFQFSSQFSKETLDSFYDYWTEENRQTGRLKFEDEKYWNLESRISNWKVFSSVSNKKEPNNFYLNR